MEKRRIVVPFVVVDGKVIEGKVKVVCNVSKGRGVDKVELFKELEHTFDYAGVTLADLVDKAATSDVISLQSVWRDMSPVALKEEHKGVTDMADFYNRTVTRAPADPTKALLKAMDTGKVTMTDEELQAYIAQLTAIANKGK